MSSTLACGRIRKRSSSTATRTSRAIWACWVTWPAEGDGAGGRDAARIPGLRTGVEQLGVDAHRARAADPHPVVPVGDRKPFGESDRGVFGHGVGRRPIWVRPAVEAVLTK